MFLLWVVCKPYLYVCLFGARKIVILPPIQSLIKKIDFARNMKFSQDRLIPLTRVLPPLRPSSSNWVLLNKVTPHWQMYNKYSKTQFVLCLDRIFHSLLVTYGTRPTPHFGVVQSSNNKTHDKNPNCGKVVVPYCQNYFVFGVLSSYFLISVNPRWFLFRMKGSFRCFLLPPSSFLVIISIDRVDVGIVGRKVGNIDAAIFKLPVGFRHDLITVRW